MKKTIITCLLLIATTYSLANEYSYVGDTLIYPPEIYNGTIASTRVNSGSDSYKSLRASTSNDFNKNCEESSILLAKEVTLQTMI